MTLESMKIEQENKEDFDELGELGPIHEEPLEQQHPHQFISQPSLNFIPSEKAIIGTPITVNHKNYLLMFDMLNGIKLSVSRLNSRQDTQLSPSDFEKAYKIAFDITGNEIQPKTSYEYKFKDYCPFVFKLIRAIFGINSSDYLHSLTAKFVLSELGSPGKSGSFFYFSIDYRFIIKTISKQEFKKMRDMLQSYYEHVKENPETLISRIFGLHRVKQANTKKYIYFVVMGNVFPPNRDIHQVFDLKGSTFGRFTNPEESKNNPSCVLKDLNWIQQEQKICLGPIKEKLLKTQLEKDIAFCEKENIMDYSLLIGIHDLKKGNTETFRGKSLIVLDAPVVSEQTSSKKRKSSNKRVRTISDPVLLTPTNTKITENSPPERKTVFYSDFGGFQSTNENDEPLMTVYFIGVIDIFTEYGLKKRTETFFKKILQGGMISAVKPKTYAKRFMDFVYSSFSGGGEEDEEEKLEKE